MDGGGSSVADVTVRSNGRSSPAVMRRKRGGDGGLLGGEGGEGGAILDGYLEQDLDHMYRSPASPGFGSTYDDPYGTPIRAHDLANTMEVWTPWSGAKEDRAEDGTPRTGGGILNGVDGMMIDAGANGTSGANGTNRAMGSAWTPLGKSAHKQSSRRQQRGQSSMRNV